MIVSKWISTQLTLREDGSVRIQIGKDTSKLLTCPIYMLIPKKHVDSSRIEKYLRESDWIETEE